MLGSQANEFRLIVILNLPRRSVSVTMIYVVDEV